MAQHDENTLYFHGNDNKIHRFSEYRPSFFSTDKDYAAGYGKYVYPYTIKAKKIFDTATDEEARKYFNEVFRKDILGAKAKEIQPREHISFIDADDFWAFIAVEEQLGKGAGYDAMLVCEGTNIEDHFKTALSLVPFEVNQIQPAKKLQEYTPEP
ncbi:hypothetical protein AB4254_10830 [Vibrio breoganii]